MRSCALAFCFSASGTKAHAIYNVVQTRFQQLNQGLARVATATLCLLKIPAELLFQNAIHALELLLFTQLQTEVGSARTRGAAMLTRFGLDLAFGVERATSTLQE